MPDVKHLFSVSESLFRFNISTPAFRGCMKNLKKTTGVVRLNDTVGVTKKCSEDWQVTNDSKPCKEVFLTIPSWVLIYYYIVF